MEMALGQSHGNPQPGALPPGPRLTQGDPRPCLTSLSGMSTQVRKTDNGAADGQPRPLDSQLTAATANSKGPSSLPSLGPCVSRAERLAGLDGGPWEELRQRQEAAC